MALSSGPARAVPIDDPHIGGIGFSGPTTGDLAAVYWNPAALGLIGSYQATFTGTATAATTTVSRASIDSTGNPGAGTSFMDVRASDRSHPFIWPFGPGAFAGFGGPIGGDRFTLAVAMYMPFVERSSYQAPAGELLATRYHRISSDVRNLALVPAALAVRFLGDFRLGFAPGVLFSTGRLSFSESTCNQTGTCTGPEDPAGDAHLDLGSDQGIFSSNVSITLAAGVYYRKRAWEFGFSFSSPPLGGDVGGSSVIGGDKSKITRADGAPLTCDNKDPDGKNCAFADIVYKLPYTFTAAVAWHPRPGWEIAAIGRLLSFGGNDVVDIRLTGSRVADAGVPAHIVLHRGYDTVIDTRLRAAYWIGERIRVGGGIRFENSALSEHAISPAAVDGRKLEPTAMLLFRPVKHVWVGAGYGFTYMFPVTTATSDFAPGAASECIAAGGALDSPACQKRNQGLARPTAAGTYSHNSHALSLSVTAQF